MKFLFLFLFIVLNASLLWSQSRDSIDKVQLQQSYAFAKQALRNAEWDVAIAYADTMYHVAKRINHSTAMIGGLILKGEGNIEKKDFLMAYKCYNEGRHFIDSTGYEGDVKGRLYKGLFILFSIQNQQDSIEKYVDIIFNLPCEKSTIIAKSYVARRLLDSNQPKKALLWASKNADCAKELDANSMFLNSLIFINNIYQKVEDYETAILYLDSILTTAQVMEDSLSIVLAYSRLGSINTILKNNSKALEWNLKSVELAEEIYSKDGFYSQSDLLKSQIPLGDLYAHLAAAYQNVDNQNETNNYIDSINLYNQKGLQFFYKNNDTWNIASTLVEIARTIIESGGSSQEALDSLEKAYEIAPRHIKWTEVQYYIHSVKGEIYTELEEFDQAQIYLDSAEIIAHASEDSMYQLIELYLLKKELFIAKKDYKKAYDYEIKTTALNKKREEQKQKQLLLGFEIKYATEQVQQQNILLAKERDIQQLEAEQNRLKAERNQQWIYAGAVLLFLIIIISILLILQFRNKAFFLTQKLEYQLLRNQMNPHFIFNALTAIQSFVYKKKPVEAGEYIASFAELMRAILDNSQEEYVSLNKEIQWLENYLKLQLLRFGNQFDYTLRLDPQIDLEDTMIPPMLTQPFIENALEHGLKDIDYKGHLDININVHNDLLEVDVLDNGIGLEESKKNNENKVYESKATKITQERLNFLNTKQAKNINLKIQPNEGKGTKVSFTIPFISKY